MQPLVAPLFAEAYGRSVAAPGSHPCSREDAVRCHAVVLPPAGALCLRANTMPRFLAANLGLLAHRTAHGVLSPLVRPEVARAKGLKETVVGEGCTFGGKVSLQRCVVGKGCTVGARSKLNGCILMDGAVVGEGCERAGGWRAGGLRAGGRTPADPAPPPGSQLHHSEHRHRRRGHCRQPLQPERVPGVPRHGGGGRRCVRRPRFGPTLPHPSPPLPETRKGEAVGFSDALM